MAIKAVVETLEGVDEAYHSLYTERDGKFEITGVEGMKTAADTDRLSKALKSERDVSAGHKAKLAAFGDHTPDTIEDLQSRFDDAELRLEAAGGDKGPDKEALDKLVETRAGVRIKPLERQFAKLQKEFDTVTGERNALAKERSRNTVVSAV